MSSHLHARRVGNAAPESGEARDTGHAAGLLDQDNEEPDCFAAGRAAQHAPTLEGESYGQAYLDRIGAGIAQPDDLASTVAFLRDEILHGFCRLVQKALEGARHG